jgi:hypothetical protein
MLTLRLAAEGADALVADGRILDVRKRGVISIAGQVNSPGVVHDMAIRLVLDRRSLEVRSAGLRMPSVPFPDGVGHAGETCRDNEAGFARVIGLTLGPGFTARLQRTIGGPRGCFHVFTIMRLLGPTVEWSLADTDHRPFERAVVIDGLRTAAGLTLRGTLADARIAEGARGAADTFEADAELSLEMPGLIVSGLAERHRRGGGPWSEADLENVEGIAGMSILRTYGLAIERVVSARGPLAPVHQLLLMLQPVAFQCMPALSGVRAEVSPARRAGPVAAVDSCSMWRRGGPLLATLQEGTDAGAH